MSPPIPTIPPITQVEVEHRALRVSLAIVAATGLVCVGAAVGCYTMARALWQHFRGGEEVT